VKLQVSQTRGDEAEGGESLDRAKGDWLVGDWQALVALDTDALEQHPARDRMALLCACGLLQRGEVQRARQRLKQALAWECDAALAARLLLSGVHNSLGRVAALRRDAAGLERHFSEALALTGDPASAPVARTRAVRELARLGLLPQASELLSQRTEAIAQESALRRPAGLAAEITMLRSEVQLLQHELSLVQQRAPMLLLPGLVSGTDVAVAEGTRAEIPTPDTLRALSTSQLGQDLWVLERSGHKRGGYFIEFGATDGVRLSNTFLLERWMGWHGICAEPNPRYLSDLQRQRQCIVSDACVGPSSGEWVDFVMAEEFGGMQRDMSRDMHAATREAYWADGANRARLQTVSLHDLLLQHGAPRDIDYLSIDTEGSELAILSAFPFDRWNIRLITVEHNWSADREGLQRLLEPLGYRRTEAQWDDWYERS